MIKVSSLTYLLFVTLYLFSCATPTPRKNPLGEVFPTVTGQSLDGKTWVFPKDLQGQKVFLLIGYEQDAQFDIDRWLIGIDQKQYVVDLFEVPTIEGLIPGLISGTIDRGMRSGIPEELWKIVVTIYDDADKVIAFTGNEDPLNARVVALDEKGEVLFFHDRGFSVAALNQLSAFFPSKKPEACK